MQSPSGPLNNSPVSSSIFNSVTGYKLLAYLGMKPTAPTLLSIFTANHINIFKNNYIFYNYKILSQVIANYCE